MAGQSTPNSSTVRLVIILVVGVALCLLFSIAGSYVVGLHEGGVAARKIIHADQIAQEGRSKALCGVLKQLAETNAAVKLHPIFEHVYSTSGCPRVTGKATP